MKTFPVHTLLVLLLALALGSSVAAGDVPRTILYEGVLTDADGVPLDGAQTLTFLLYDDGGNPQGWTETHPVDVSAGIFQVVLGADTAFPAFDQVYELAIEIGGTELSPRIPLHATPYALQVADDTITASHIVDGTVGTAELADASVSLSKLDATDPDDGEVLGVSGGALAWVAAVGGAPRVSTVDVTAGGVGETLGATEGFITDAELTVTADAGAGLVIVTSNVRVEVNHDNGTADVLILNHVAGNDATAGLVVTETRHEVPATDGDAVDPVVTIKVVSTHAIGAGETATYRLAGWMESGQSNDDRFIAAQMTAVYYPTP